MTTKNYLINYKIMSLFFLFIGNIYSEETAQLIFEKVYKKNQLNDGYYDGNITILLPYKKKEIFEFSMLKKETSIFWDIKKQEKMRFRILCKNEFNKIYVYDKLRDTLKQFHQQDIIKNWYYIPIFLYCDVPFETILDPQIKELQKEEILIYSNFFIPYVQFSSIIHIDNEYRLKKMLIFKKHMDINHIEFRIFYLYDQPISILKKNQIEAIKTDHPTELEVIDAKNRNVVKIQWLYYRPDYKMDDIRFMPEFISR